jgi:hypothetical protein
MGYVSLMGPDGRVRAKSFFGAEGDTSQYPEIANDGYLTQVEISEARQRLEEVINGRDCGYGGPLGLGGWGGINEVCLQPWNMGGPAREKTPDGYIMKVKLQIVEEYRERVGYIFHELKKTPPEVIEVTIRWEQGKVRLYQCEPPPYLPPASPPPTPEIIPELRKAGNFLLAGVNDYLKQASAYSVSAFKEMPVLLDSALSYIDSAISGGQNELAKYP